MMFLGHCKCFLQGTSSKFLVIYNGNPILLKAGLKGFVTGSTFFFPPLLLLVKYREREMRNYNIKKKNDKRGGNHNNKLVKTKNNGAENKYQSKQQEWDK
jgi:hypothetical protein